MAYNLDKKAVNWDEDTDIMRRLSTVASMMVQGAKTYQIAETMGYSLRTAQRDCNRVRDLWMREAALSVEESRAANIAQYEEIKASAWRQYRQDKSYYWLKVVMDAENRISELQGTKRPLGVDITSKGEALFSAREMSDDELAAIIAGEPSGGG